MLIQLKYIYITISSIKIVFDAKIEKKKRNRIKDLGLKILKQLGP